MRSSFLIHFLGNAQDIIDASKILKEMGSHIVVGVRVGGRITSTIDLSTNHLLKNGELKDANVEQELKNIIEKSIKEQSRQYKQKTNFGKYQKAKERACIAYMESEHRV